MLNSELKNILLVQTQPIYEETNQGITEKQIMERIEIFNMVLSYADKCEAESLKSVDRDITSVIESIGRTARTEINKNNINLIEPYLRLLCYLVDKNGFYKREMETATLMKLYSHKKLDILNTLDNPEREDYYDILAKRDENNIPLIYGDLRHPEVVLKDDTEIIPFVKAYCLRNAVVHYQRLPKDKWEHFLCMFYTMIEAAYKNKDIIISLYIDKEISRKKFINSIINDYEEKLKQNFTYIPLNIDIFVNDLYDELDSIYNISENNITFENINEDINDNKLPYNKAKLIGYAGMGKTTTIENVIYKEALNIKQNNYEGKLPILIEMIQVSKKEQNIESLIAQKLDTENFVVVKELLKRNMVNLYIDGVNEIRIGNRFERKEYLENLEEFILKNMDIKVIITDRDSYEKSILNNYPTFTLNGVTEERIEEFINGNSTKPDKVKDKILKKIEESPSFIEILRNPFMLKNLISIVECNKEIPEYEDDIAEVFLKAIVDRERVEKRDYNAPHILRLLIYVVGKYVEMNNGKIEENMVISYYKLIDLFNEYCDRYKKNDRFDNDEMLNLIVKLGILKQIDVEKYTFVDERYYNFFYYSSAELL